MDLLQVMLNTLSAQGLSDQQLMHIMRDVFERLQTNDFNGQAAQRILTALKNK